MPIGPDSVTVIDLTNEQLVTLLDSVANEYTNWIVNNLPPELTPISRRDAIKLAWLLARKIQNDINQQALSQGF